MARSRGRTALLGAVGVAIACAGPALSASAGPTRADLGGGGSDRSTTFRVQGTQVLVDAATATYRMEGGLIGIWRMYPTEPALHDVSSLYVEAGLERFSGCIDRNHNGSCDRRDPSGLLASAYLYWATFDRDERLVRGQCVHPVTGGREDFRGARGVITMVDRPVGDEVVTTYRGEVVLHAVASDPRATILEPALPEDAAVRGSGAAATSGAGASDRRAC